MFFGVSVGACTVQLSFDEDANVGAVAVREKAEENSAWTRHTDCRLVGALYPLVLLSSEPGILELALGY